METVQDPLYSTSDLYFAAFLKASKVFFKGTSKTGSRMFFNFEHSGMIEGLRMGYYNHTVKVDPLSFVQEIRIMKNFIHEQG